MKEFHCSHCNKLLGMIDGKAEIKCPRCKTMNRLDNSLRHDTIIGEEKGNNVMVYDVWTKQ